jgi:hypothetical protein
MKRRHITLLILLAAAGVLLLTLSTCSAFFLPELPRTNPYDENAVVAPVENLDATVTDPATIKLTWTMPAERVPVSLAIIENRVQFPQSIDDGYRYDITDPAAGSWTHESVEQEETIYYGVWSIAADGTAVGPLHVKEAIALISSELTPEIDGYEAWDGGSYFDDYNSSTLSISYYSTLTEYYNSLIKFDLSEIETELIESASFSLYVYMMDNTIDDTLSFAPINQDWDTTVQYDTTDPDTFVDTNYSYSELLPMDFTGLLTFDVKDLVTAWLSGKENYGIRLKGTTTTAITTDFFASENGVNVPTLTVEYYGETY